MQTFVSMHSFHAQQQQHCQSSMSESRQKVTCFLQWLESNGATFPKISWPRNDTPSGFRGAIALEDIATNEHMIQIPAKLMMSPPQFIQHAQMGDAVRKCLDVMQGDLLLTVYIMHELRLKENSFYKPYLDILPQPDGITEWRNNELLLLQVLN
jgi:hypothetical protein